MKRKPNNFEREMMSLLRKELIIGIVVGFMFFVSILGVMFAFYMYNENHISNSYSPDKDIFSMINITYDGLNQNEIMFFESVFSQINPIYLYENEHIIVVKNISEYCDNCEGQNINKGEKIVIKFHRNEDYFKEIISHELLHTYIKFETGSEDKDHPLHRIVYDLGFKNVVFK